MQRAQSNWNTCESYVRTQGGRGQARHRSNPLSRMLVRCTFAVTHFLPCFRTCSCGPLASVRVRHARIRIGTACMAKLRAGRAEQTTLRPSAPLPPLVTCYSQATTLNASVQTVKTRLLPGAGLIQVKNRSFAILKSQEGCSCCVLCTRRIRPSPLPWCCGLFTSR